MVTRNSLQFIASQKDKIRGVVPKVIVISEDPSSIFLDSSLPLNTSLLSVPAAGITFLPTCREIILDDAAYSSYGQVVAEMVREEGPAGNTNEALLLNIRDCREVNEAQINLHLHDVTVDGKTLIGDGGRLVLIRPGQIEGLEEDTSLPVGSRGNQVRVLSTPGGSGVILENLGFWHVEGKFLSKPGNVTRPSSESSTGTRSVKRHGDVMSPLFLSGFPRLFSRTLAWGQYFRDTLTSMRNEILVLMVSERWIGPEASRERQTTEHPQGWVGNTNIKEPGLLGIPDEVSRWQKDEDGPGKRLRGSLFHRGTLDQKRIMLFHEVRVAGIPVSFETLRLNESDLPWALGPNFGRGGAPSGRVDTVGGDLDGPVLIILRGSVDTVARLQFVNSIGSENPVTLPPGETARCIWEMTGRQDCRDQGEPVKEMPKVLIDMSSEDVGRVMPGTEERLLDTLTQGGSVCAMVVSNLGSYRSSSWGVTGE